MSISNLVNNFKNADIHRAGNGAFAASYTEIFAKALLVINKLMHGALPPPAIFNRTGIMTAGHKGKIAVVTGVIALVANAGIFHFFIRNLKAMAGGTNKRTSVTTHAITRNIFKFRGIEDLG